MSSAFPEETTTYDPDLREKWQSGILPKKWHEAYPDLFDDDDLRLALSQPSWHFYEWLGALHYYKKGFLVLVEQYIYRPHPRKLAILSRMVSEDDLRFLRELPAQPPDLFVYRDEYSYFFFAEIKSATDALSDSQRIAFAQSAERLATEVRILRVLPQ